MSTIVLKHWLLVALISAVVALDPDCSSADGECTYTVDLEQGRNYNVNGSPVDVKGTSCCATAETQISSLQVDILNKLAELGEELSSLEAKRNGTPITNEVLKKITRHGIGEYYSQLRDELTSQVLTLSDIEARLNNLISVLTQQKGNLPYIENELRYKTKEVSLKRSISQLGSHTREAEDEIQRLRNELSKATDELKICHAALHVTTGGGDATPALYGDIKVTGCSFEDSDHLCGYTQDRHDSGDWTLGHASADSTLTGPSEDHSFGSPHGHYWFVDSKHLAASSSVARTETVRMTSPEFTPAQDYCVKFAYSMYGEDIRTLRLYASVHNGLGYPVFTATGNKGVNWLTAEIHLDSEYTQHPFKLVFEGTTNSHRSYSSFNGYHYYNFKGDIAIDDVYVYNTSCKALPKCPPNSITRTDNLGKNSCYTFHWSSETWYHAYESCRTEHFSGHLVTIGDKDEQEFLVREIKNNADLTAAGHYGFWTSGNDEMSEASFKWTDTGTPSNMTYTNWKPGQPNNVADDQDCLLMEYPDLNYQWGDIDCDEKHLYICEVNY